MKFNPILTIREYNAMSAEDKREWDDQWLEAASEKTEIIDVVWTGAIVAGKHEMADPKDMIGE